MTIANERAVTFDCAGDSCLGIVHETTAASDTGVLIIVGGPQYRVGSHRQFVVLARSLAASGYPVFRFDYRGMGDSTGEQRDFRSISSDIDHAIGAFMAELPALRSVVIFGLCDAASAALMHGSTDVRIKGLILANPWVRTDVGLARVHVKHYYLRRFLQGSFWRKLSGGRLGVRASLQELAGSLRVALFQRAAPKEAPSAADFVTAMRKGFEAFTRPVLLLISGRDLTAREFMDLCSTRDEWRALIEGCNVTTLHNAGVDHTFSSQAGAEWVNLVCADWLATHARSH